MSIKSTFQAIIRHLFADSANVTLTDDGVTVTGDLTDTAVTPGSYTNSSLTVDQKGRLTAASSATNTLNLQEINQDLATTDDPTFNTLTLTAATGSTINAQDMLALDYSAGNNGQVLGVVAGALSWVAQTDVAEVAHFYESQLTTVKGGTFTSGAWRTRTLNTQIGSVTIASLATNTITILVDGDYLIMAFAPALQVRAHAARININSGSTTIVGSSQWSSATANYATNSSFVVTVQSLSTNDTIILEHQCETTRADYGFGDDSPFSDSIYSQVILMKIS